MRFERRLRWEKQMQRPNVRTWLVPTRTIFGSAPSSGTEGGASKATGFSSSDTG